MEDIIPHVKGKGVNDKRSTMMIENTLKPSFA
jgi:hypothetical protein